MIKWFKFFSLRGFLFHSIIHNFLNSCLFSWVGWWRVRRWLLDRSISWSIAKSFCSLLMEWVDFWFNFLSLMRWVDFLVNPRLFIRFLLSCFTLHSKTNSEWFWKGNTMLRMSPFFVLNNNNSSGMSSSSKDHGNIPVWFFLFCNLLVILKSNDNRNIYLLSSSSRPAFVFLERPFV